MKYFVVDCRPLDQYSCGHLPGSYQLDPNLVSVSQKFIYLYVIIYTLHPTILGNFICISLYVRRIFLIKLAVSNLKHSLVLSTVL